MRVEKTWKVPFFGLGVVVVAFHLVFHPEFLWVDTCYCHIGLFVLLAEPLLTPAGLTMFLKFQKSEKKFKEVFKFVFGFFFHQMEWHRLMILIKECCCKSLRYLNNHLCTYWFFHYFWHDVSQLDPLLGNPGKKEQKIKWGCCLVCLSKNDFSWAQYTSKTTYIQVTFIGVCLSLKVTNFQLVVVNTVGIRLSL